MRLKDKCALIIGAGSVGPGWGNGRATAAVMVREGATVFGTDRDAEALSTTLQMITDAHGRGIETRVTDINNSCLLYTSPSPRDA